MVRRATRVLTGVAVISALVAASPARADLPPPDGMRVTGYGLRVDNLEAFPGFVVLAYPASPTDRRSSEFVEVKPGVVASPGRRMKPDLYAVRRADYAAWTAAHPDVKPDDPAIEALFADTSRVKKCDADVVPRSTIATDNPGDNLDIFKAEAIDENRCDIVLVAAMPSVQSPSPASTAPTSAPAEPAPTRQAAGCSVGDAAPGLLALLLPWLRRRRRD